MPTKLNGLKPLTFPNFIYILFFFNLILCSQVYSATWKSISKNDINEISYDQESLKGTLENRKINIKINVLKDPKEGDKSRLLQYSVNCNESILKLEEVRRYSESELNGTEAVFKGNDKGNVPQPNTFGQKYLSLACYENTPAINNATPTTNLSPATNEPSWGNAGEVNFIGQGNAIKNLEVSLYVDTAIKASTTQPFAARLLLGKSSGGFYLIMDNSSLNYTNSIKLDLAIDCKKGFVKQINAIAYSEEMGRGKVLDTIMGDVFGIFTLKTSKVQGANDAKQLATKYYCQQAQLQEKKNEDAEARRRFLESPEGKKYLVDEEVKRKKAEDERLKSEATERARIVKEFPFYAVISCGIGSGHMTITACFSGDYGSLEIRNGSEYGLYKIVQIANRMIPNSNEQGEGLIVNLRNNFEINARNGESKNIILGVKIIQRNTGNIVFQKQVDNFGSIRIKN